MKRILICFAAILICLLSGYIASQFQLDALLNWYPHLNKPELTPPNWVFPIAWTILYICMGISIGLVVSSQRAGKGLLVLLFAVQLALNFSWSIVFFYFHSPLGGMVNILVLELLMIIYALKCYKNNKLSAWLFAPYILWVGFACYLNAAILLNN